MNQLSLDHRWRLPAAGLAVFILGLLASMGLARPAHAEILNYCWGVTLKEGNACYDSTARYNESIWVSGAEGPVCGGVKEVGAQYPVWFGCQNSANEYFKITVPQAYANTKTYAAVGYLNLAHTGPKSTVAYGSVGTWAGPPGGGGPSPPEGRWYLRNSNTTGIADTEFLFGGPELLPISGDWNNDGTDTPGQYNKVTGQWYLRNSNTAGVGEINFTYGGGGNALPIAGDWNGDGVDTPGIYDPSNCMWFLRNSNTGGGGEISFCFGGGGLLPVVGDWNNDGIDTPGLYDKYTGQWYLRNSNTAGAGEINFTYGGGGELMPVVGDWNKDGVDTPGLYKTNAEWYLRNSNTSGVGEVNFLYGGGSGSKPIAGDWNNDGIDSIGMVR
jgi:hypothetical protein